MTLWVALGFLLIPTRFAWADVSLVQVVQAQRGSADPRGGGAEPRGGAPERGLLAKSLIEVSGSRMRMVTAVVRKTGAGEAGGEKPWRLVQVLDLATTSLLVIDPDSRSYERRSLSSVVDGPPVPARLRVHEVASSSITLTPGTMTRRCMGADCSHVHVSVKLSLKGGKPARLKARLEQDIWIAPLTGEAQKGLLDLIAFEAAYRRQSGLELSPMDRQSYRVREAAEYLGVAPEQLEAVLGKVRRALRDLPGYPLSSSVSWSCEGPVRAAAGKSTPPIKTEPRLLQEPPPPPPPPPRRSLVRVDWHGGWKRLDRALAQAGFGRAPRGPAAGPRAGELLQGYERFQTELAAVVEALDKATAPAMEVPRELPAENGGLTAPPIGGRAPREPKAGGEARIYEAFSEIGELVSVDGIPDDHFHPPAGFKKK